nr:hypothetical protein [Tanacetum cinerariifolium]
MSPGKLIPGDKSPGIPGNCRRGKWQIGEEDQLSAKHQLAVKGLFECKASGSNIRRIQVKYIVKKFKDYLKTYSSAEMDISCFGVDAAKDFKENMLSD